MRLTYPIVVSIDGVSFQPMQRGAVRYVPDEMLDAYPGGKTVLEYLRARPETWGYDPGAQEWRTLYEVDPDADMIVRIEK